jgi:hypothetical protein
MFTIFFEDMPIWRNMSDAPAEKSAITLVPVIVFA